MVPRVTENNGAITLTAHGRHTSMTVEDAEEFLEDLETAIEKAKQT